MATMPPIKLAVIVRPEAEVKAEALREAADLIYGDDGPEYPLSIVAWLRERADALTKGGA